MRRPSRPEVKIPGNAETDQQQTASSTRLCAAEGCTAEAHYPAPKSRDALRDYIWFCLEHIRAYNKSWNYYEGLQGAALEDGLEGEGTPAWPRGTTTQWRGLEPRTTTDVEIQIHHRPIWRTMRLPPRQTLATECDVCAVELDPPLDLARQPHDR